jgi:hypothetical protein
MTESHADVIVLTLEAKKTYKGDILLLIELP